MKYPSVYLSKFADWLETYEPHEKIEALADKVEDIEQPVETRLDWLYERLTAYRRLQEVRQELELLRKDRAALARAYARLASEYAEQTGERPNAPESEAVRALQRSKTESVFVGLRRVLSDLQYKSRG